jgi:hypothetical protein
VGRLEGFEVRASLFVTMLSRSHIAAGSRDVIVFSSFPFASVGAVDVRSEYYLFKVTSEGTGHGVWQSNEMLIACISDTTRSYFIISRVGGPMGGPENTAILET